MAVSLSRRIAGVGRLLRKEAAAAWPAFLFFLTGFLLLILLIKLVLAEFSIEISAVSNAVIGALIAAKAALVLDETPLARSLENYRRIVAVALKTFFYGIATLLMGYLERFLEVLHKVHGFAEAIQEVIAHANHYRLLAWALGNNCCVCSLLRLLRDQQRKGERALGKLFFEPPGAGNR